MLQPKLKSVQTETPYKLILLYETGEKREFDVAPYINGSWYGELRNPAYFQTVKVLPGGVGVEWMNGQDIAPMSYMSAVLLFSKNPIGRMQNSLIWGFFAVRDFHEHGFPKRKRYSYKHKEC